MAKHKTGESTRMIRLRQQRQVIYVGVAAALLTQYDWMLPVPYVHLIDTALALACCVVGLVWMIVDGLRGSA